MRVAGEVKETWLRDLRYRHWEVHRLRTTATTVELHVATRVDQISYYITGLIVVPPGAPALTPSDLSKRSLA
ncbi:hypothetical protein FBZ33_3933 [Micromonospora sp. A202]|nr:hypothetical protein FBZ33_3933 [Micromonospora sp. A202]